MSDAFANRMRSPSDPAIKVFDVTPDDASDLPYITTSLNVATPGTVYVTTVDGSESSVYIHPGNNFALRVRRVWQTGTTATGIRGLN